MIHCRKNQSTLSASEKAKFVAAVIALKSNGTYNTFVADHASSMTSAHRGPAFFPWHREFLRRFELALQAVDADVTLPYWDWTVDNSTTSSIWNADFMGGNGRPSDSQVMTGPFAFNTGNFPLVGFPAFLRRRFGSHFAAPTLPTAADVSAALAVTPYDASPYNDGSATGGFRNRMEGWFSGGANLHNRVHVWVGGSMGPSTSPNDPVFFLHHCFIDKLWADWQAAHPGAGYLPASGAATGHNLNNAMEPWASGGETITPASVLNHHNLGYAYDTEGICMPTIKFFDDKPSLKFNDDVATLKFNDDGPTLKFSDDKPSLKFNDDVGTLKFSDDGPSLKFQDDVKNPGLDKHPITDTKHPGLDKSAISDNPFQRPELGNPAPFILSTPHHSMAWAKTFPEAHRARVAELESTLTQMHQQIQEINNAHEKGLITNEDMPFIENLNREYQNLLAEYQQLTQQS